MDQILRPWARAQYANGRRRFEVRPNKGGWYYYFDMVDLNRAERLLLPTVSAETVEVSLDAHTQVAIASKDIPQFQVVDNGPVRGVILQPWVVDMDYEVGGEPACWKHYDYRCQVYYPFVEPGADTWRNVFSATKGTATIGDRDEWLDFVKSADKQFVEIVQKQSVASYSVVENAPVRTIVMLNQETCPNGWFAFGVRRQAISEEAAEFLNENQEATFDVDDLVCTTAWFGGMTSDCHSWIPEDKVYYAWGLRVPFNGRPFLVRGYAHPDGWVGKGGGEWENQRWEYHRVNFDGGELSDVGPLDMAMNGRTYMVGVIGNAVCVSDSQFRDFAYKVVRNAAQPIVPGGRIQVTNFPGQCALWFAPVRFTVDEELVAGADAKLSLKTYWVPHAPVRPSRARHYGYGFAVTGWELPIPRYKWGDKPDWWPDGAAWPPDDPPGTWGPFPPGGWPEDRSWPPQHTQPHLIMVVDEDETWWEADPTQEEMEIPMWRGTADLIEDDYPLWVGLEGGAIEYETFPVGDGPPYPAFFWRISMEQAKFQDSIIAPLATYTTPFVQALTVWQWAEVTDNGDPTFSNIPVPHMVRAQEGMDSEADSLYELGVSNQIIPGAGGQDMIPFYAVRKAASIRAQVGVTIADSPYLIQHDLGEFVAIQKNASAREAVFVLADWLQMLQLDKWSDGMLNFREWPSVRAILFMLMQAGLVADDWEEDESTGIITAPWLALENIGTILTDFSD
ncbi:MAG: hypothetical protein PHZ19_11140 [Candidatus Thermoplasmatota archaeon]|nr:hypothetical protein [Candidatus Thermoplasmatota archaeon]